jgi:hypothetical protein
MLKALLFLITVFTSSNSLAQWEVYGDSPEAFLYIDYSTVRKDGNLRKVWELQDRKQRHKDGELSLRIRVEYDCKEERYRYLSATSHSSQMAQGNLVNTQTGPSNWIDIAPRTVTEDKLKKLCSK